MGKRKNAGLGLIVLFVVCAVVAVWWKQDILSPVGQSTAPNGALTNDETDKPEEKPEKSRTESQEEFEEEAVEIFDGLVDQWMEPTAKTITMAEVDGFAKSFQNLPKTRQDECIHRALNLIPDENIILLVGILTDKTIDRELVETIFSDILNRDEDVKIPILRQIFADKSHPCWRDAAWVLDVTGNLPPAQRQ